MWNYSSVNKGAVVVFVPEGTGLFFGEVMGLVLLLVLLPMKPSILRGEVWMCCCFLSCSGEHKNLPCSGKVLCVVGGV